MKASGKKSESGEGASYSSEVDNSLLLPVLFPQAWKIPPFTLSGSVIFHLTWNSP